MAPAVEGAANNALIRLLAEELGIARRDVRIVAGATSRQKLVVDRRRRPRPRSLPSGPPPRRYDRALGPVAAAAEPRPPGAIGSAVRAHGSHPWGHWFEIQYRPPHRTATGIRALGALFLCHAGRAGSSATSWACHDRSAQPAQTGTAYRNRARDGPCSRSSRRVGALWPCGARDGDRDTDWSCDAPSPSDQVCRPRRPRPSAGRPCGSP